MRKYILTSKKQNGNISLKYSDNGLLSGFEYNILNSDNSVHEWFIKHLPLSLERLEALAKAPNNTITVTEQFDELTFDAFWNNYKYKIGNKTKCSQLWNKLTDAEKQLALNSIRKYDSWVINKGIDKVYPERYLSQRRFENDFRL